QRDIFRFDLRRGVFCALDKNRPRQAAFERRGEPGIIRWNDQSHRAIEPGEGSEFAFRAMRDEAAFLENPRAELRLLKFANRCWLLEISEQTMRQIKFAIPRHQ